MWLQIYFNIIQAPNTLKNRNVLRYNLRIFTAENCQNIRIFRLGRENINDLKKKRVYGHWNFCLELKRWPGPVFYE